MDEVEVEVLDEEAVDEWVRVGVMDGVAVGCGGKGTLEEWEEC